MTNTTNDNKKLKKVIWRAFVIRIIVLSVTVLFSDSLSTGYFSNSATNDDLKYIAVAESYVSSARNAIDLPTFYSATNSYGHLAQCSDQNFWFWFCCIISYITGTTFSIRVVNVLLAVLSVKIIYEYATENYGSKVGLSAAKLIAYMPYPVLFSCFAFKDQMLMVVTFYSLLIFSFIIHRRKINLIKWVALIIALVSLWFSRGGFAQGFIVIIACAYLFRTKWNPVIKYALVLIIGLLMTSIIGYDKILYYVRFYTTSRTTSEASSFSFLAINGLGDLIKLPLLMVFNIFLPLNFSFSFQSWSNFADILNCAVIPTIVGNVLYFVNYKQKKEIMYWVTMCLYIGGTIISFGIYRHLYFLLPIHYINFANFKYRNTSKEGKQLLIIGSAALLLLLCVYFLIKQYQG